MSQRTHAELCDIAVKWLKRPNSARGHGCSFAASETPSGFDGEIPDAFGSSTGYGSCESVVVECKTSRADFLADRKKDHRADGKGLGNYRYFMCPTGLIRPDELPERWGLLYVNEKGHVKPVAGPAEAYGCKNGWMVKGAEIMFWHDGDEVRERWLLTRLLSRVGDPEQLNKTLKATYKEASEYRDRSSRLATQLEEAQKKVRQLERELRAYRSDVALAG